VEKYSSHHLSPVLAALQYQGQSNDCGPFTTATVINALRGLNLRGEQLALHMNRPVFRGIIPLVRRIPNWATFPWGMVDVFREYGLKASWRLLASPQFLQESFDKGYLVMPVIGQWKPLWAHVMTLLSWDPDMGWGFANTQRDDHEIDWFSNESFLPRWKAMGRLVIVVRNPES
jgi:hypothetical protein